MQKIKIKNIELTFARKWHVDCMCENISFLDVLSQNLCCFLSELHLDAAQFIKAAAKSCYDSIDVLLHDSQQQKGWFMDTFSNPFRAIEAK